jgi:hypothetical protein
LGGQKWTDAVVGRSGAFASRAEGEDEMKPAPSLKGQAWTAEDDARLKCMIEANMPTDLIAAKMKRTTQGVKSRAQELGITTKRVWVGLKAKK